MAARLALLFLFTIGPRALYCGVPVPIFTGLALRPLLPKYIIITYVMQKLLMEISTGLGLTFYLVITCIILSCSACYVQWQLRGA